MTTTLLPAQLDNVVTRIHAHGFDEASQQLAPFIQARYVQLESGTACTHGAVARLDHMIVGRVGADRNKVECLDVPRGRMLIVMPIRGRACFGTMVVAPGQAIVAHGPAQLVAFTDRDHRALFALMPDCRAGRPAQEACAFARPSVGSSVHLWRLSESEARISHRCIHRIFDEAALEATALQPIAKFAASAAVLMHLCNSWLRGQSSHDAGASEATARCHAAVRARRYIDEHLEEPLSLASVCHASYSSPRTLEYGFREIFGVSPKTYIRCSRLSHVRRELYFAPHRHGRITQLAMKFGFWHLSQFSKDYYEMFGELPSTTVGRASGRLDRFVSCNCDYVETMTLDAVPRPLAAQELAQIR